MYIYHKCEAVYGCEILSNKMVAVDGYRWYLCELHRTKFEVNRLLKDNNHE